jgi:hypothetical protein
MEIPLGPDEKLIVLFARPAMAAGGAATCRPEVPSLHFKARLLYVGGDDCQGAAEEKEDQPA